jgi:uncharacterized protein YjdB
MKEITNGEHLDKTILILPPGEEIEKKRTRVKQFLTVSNLDKENNVYDQLSEFTTIIKFNIKGGAQLLNSDSSYYESLKNIECCNYINFFERR